MFVTLASCVPDFGELMGTLAPPLVPCSILFIACVAAATVVSKRRWGPGQWTLVGWAVVYPFVQVVTGLLVASSYETAIGSLLAALLPTVISAVLLGAVTGSFIAPAGCLVGLVLVAITAGAGVGSLKEIGLLQFFVLSLPWNLAVGGSLLFWAWWVRHEIVPSGHCRRCRYDLRATRGRICPECGGESTRGGAGTWS